MASVFDYIFNIGGNFTANINGMSQAAGDFSAKVESSQGAVQGLMTALARFELVKNAIQGVADGFEQISASGIKLDSQMHDLSAVAGVTGDGLKQIETFARQSAKAFGTDASVAVEGYKLLLSQLSPELGKYPEALSAMGDCIQTTSKLMGGDGVAAAQVLTTAMNQYGVSLEDPTAASEEMARMMNVMAAAGQAGSAELPAISAALTQCGMAAKAANVSFEETNAAIQVLDKGVTNSERGGLCDTQCFGSVVKRPLYGEGGHSKENYIRNITEIFNQTATYNNPITIYNGDELNRHYNFSYSSPFENIIANSEIINFNSYVGGSNVVKYESPNFFETTNNFISNIENVNTTLLSPKFDLLSPYYKIGGLRSNGFANAGNYIRTGLTPSINPNLFQIAEPRLGIERGKGQIANRTRRNRTEPRQRRREEMLLAEAMQMREGFQMQPINNGLSADDVRGIVVETIIESLQ